MFRQQSTGRQRLTVKASVPAQDHLPLVLFVCVHNAGRSRMAEAFFNKMSDGSRRALSAGSHPSDRPHREVVLAMQHVGIDIPETAGTLLTQDLVDQAELVIGMGCSVADACPALHTPLEDWELDDPKGKSPEVVAEIRDKIELKVRNLLGKLSHPS